MIDMIATGRVVNPSAVRMTSNGSPIANFSLAVDGKVTRWVQCTLVNYNSVDELEEDIAAIDGRIITVRGRPDSQGYVDSSGVVRSKLVCWVSSMEYAETVVSGSRRGPKLVTSSSAEHPVQHTSQTTQYVPDVPDESELDFTSPSRIKRKA